MKIRAAIIILTIIFLTSIFLVLLGRKEDDSSSDRGQVVELIDKQKESSIEEPKTTVREVEISRNNKYIINALVKPTDYGIHLLSLRVTRIIDNKILLSNDFTSSNHPKGIFFNQGFKWIDEDSFMLGITAAPPYFGLDIFYIPTGKEWGFDVISTAWPMPDINGRMTFLTETEASKNKKSSQEWRDGLPVAVFEKVIYSKGNIINTGEFEEHKIQ